MTNPDIWCLCLKKKYLKNITLPPTLNVSNLQPCQPKYRGLMCLYRVIEQRIPSNNRMGSKIRSRHCQQLLLSNSIKGVSFFPSSLKVMDDAGCSVGAAQLFLQRQIQFFAPENRLVFARYEAACSFVSGRNNVRLTFNLSNLS